MNDGQAFRGGDKVRVKSLPGLPAKVWTIMSGILTKKGRMVLLDTTIPPSERHPWHVEPERLVPVPVVDRLADLA